MTWGQNEVGRDRETQNRKEKGAFLTSQDHQIKHRTRIGLNPNSIRRKDCHEKRKKKVGEKNYMNVKDATTIRVITQDSRTSEQNPTCGGVAG